MQTPTQNNTQLKVQRNRHPNRCLASIPEEDRDMTTIRYVNRTAGQRLQLGRAKHAAPLNAPDESIQLQATSHRSFFFAWIASEVHPKLSNISGQKIASLRIKMLIPIAPGYRAASKPAQMPTSNEGFQLWLQNNLFVTRMITAIQTAPIKQPAILAAKIAIHVARSLVPSIQVHGERKIG